MHSKLPDVGTTIFSKMSALALEYNAINLSQGFPDFEIDSRLSDFVREAFEMNQVQYAPMPGRADLRKNIATLIEKKYAINVNFENEITITAGATQAIFSAISAIVSPGDEVILFDPAYDCYDPSIRLFGGIPVHLKLTYPTFKINWTELEKSISSKTKLVIVNNPHNPCGSVWDQTDVLEFERILRKFPELLVISDEVYEYIHYKSNHYSVLSSDLVRSRSFVTFSFGKTLHVTGWKIGYCIAPENLTKEFRKTHQFNVFCVNNPMQYAIAKYLERTDELEKINEFYKIKKNLFLNGIKGSKFKALDCDGTYFALLDYGSISKERDTVFAENMTRDFGVASIPVSVFYQDQTDNNLLRFCFAKKDETLKQAIDKLCKI